MSKLEAPPAIGKILAPVTKPAPGRFVTILLTLTAICCTLTIIINVVVDPLWYFWGNLVSHKNWGFNEREAKVNLYLRGPGEYNCIIFGPSSATTLDTEGVSDRKCFNFAFSAGTFEEFANYAHYVKAFGVPPETIIIAVDWPNLMESPAASNTPSYVLTLSRPEPFFLPYLSIKVLNHSIRQLLSPIYDQAYYIVGRSSREMGDDHGPYIPSSIIRPNVEPFQILQPTRLGNSKPARFGQPKLNYIDEIRRLFPQSKVIGYAPPFSAWHTAQLYFQGRLLDYVATRYEIARKLDDFYDFALPSDLTISTEDTYDGLHYSPKANRVIAQAILAGRQSSDMIRIHDLTRTQYIELYRQRTLDFIERHHIQLAR